MKNFILLIFLLLIFSCSKKEEEETSPPVTDIPYFYCPDSNVQWIQYSSLFDWPNGEIYFLDIYTPDGDTNLFGNTYRRLNCWHREVKDYYDSSIPNDTFIGNFLGSVFRIDEESKRIYYPKYYAATYYGDELFIDFNLKKGDTINKSNNSYSIVYAIDSLYFNGEYLRKLQYYSYRENHFPNIDSSYILQVYDMPFGLPSQLCGNYIHPGGYSPIILVINQDTLQISSR